jgi:hypothetical protein
VEVRLVRIASTAPGASALVLNFYGSNSHIQSVIMRSLRFNISKNTLQIPPCLYVCRVSFTTLLQLPWITLATMTFDHTVATVILDHIVAATLDTIVAFAPFLRLLFPWLSCWRHCAKNTFGILVKTTVWSYYLQIFHILHIIWNSIVDDNKSAGISSLTRW